METTAEKMTDAELADKLKNAYSFPFYGTANWRRCVTMLRGRGYSDREVEAIMRSKWMRWADDGSERKRGNATAADLERFLDDARSGCARDLPGLVAETFGEPVPMPAAPARPSPARLIAEAPAMLEALRGLGDMTYPGGCWCRTCIGEHAPRCKAARDILARLEAR